MKLKLSSIHEFPVLLSDILVILLIICQATPFIGLAKGVRNWEILTVNVTHSLSDSSKSQNKTLESHSLVFKTKEDVVIDLIGNDRLDSPVARVIYSWQSDTNTD